MRKRKKGSRPRRNDILPSLRIEPYPVDALKSHVRKLRKSDPAHVREIANSVSTLGFNVPLLVGKDNVVVDGDSRLEAAKLLGLSSVPCIRVDHHRTDGPRTVARRGRVGPSPPATQSRRSADRRESHSNASQGEMAGVVERTSLGRLTCSDPASRGPVSISTPLSAQCAARGLSALPRWHEASVPGLVCDVRSQG